MIKLLVTIDHSLEASFALRMACLFGKEVAIQPIHVADRPRRDISFGAGWARKSWERETSRMAEENVEDLVVAERIQCANIADPVVLTGNPLPEMVTYFWEGKFDLLIVGAPFRDMGILDLCKRFGQMAHKERQNLPLMIVRKLKAIENIVVLSDGSRFAENTLGLLLKLFSFKSEKIVLIGMAESTSDSTSVETLHVERGLAILNEKGVQATTYRASELGAEHLSNILKEADLLVNPWQKKDPYQLLHDVSDDEIPAVLLQLDGS
jgi:hypothetical protein